MKIEYEWLDEAGKVIDTQDITVNVLADKSKWTEVLMKEAEENAKYEKLVKEGKIKTRMLDDARKLRTTGTDENTGALIFSDVVDVKF